MARFVPKVYHLQPPSQNVTPIEMHRFAPLYEHREEMGVEHHDLRPDYAFNFPVGVADPLKFAYFFSFRSRLVPPEAGHIGEVERALEPWLAAHKGKNPPAYDYMIGAGFLRISDTRHGEGRYLRLADLHRDVVLLCDQIQSRRSLAELLRDRYPTAVDDGTLSGVIDELVQADVLIAEGQQLLTLPIGRRARTTEELRELVLGPAANSQSDQPRPRVPSVTLAA